MLRINLLAVGLGGALGAVARVLLSQILPAVLFVQLPFKILAINVLGCFVLGLLTELTGVFWYPSPLIKSFLITGFLGGFTTFSAFSLEYALLIKRNLVIWALSYAILSCCLAFLAFFLGMKIVKLIYSF
jgi:CrcB protein